MSAALALLRVDFHGSDLDLVRLQDGDVGAALRVVCADVGINFASQTKRLARLRKAGARWATVVMTTTVGADGRARQMLVLPRRAIPMWAATLDVSRVAASKRERLALYQDVAADFLADRFLGPRLNPASVAALVAPYEAQVHALKVDKTALLVRLTEASRSTISPDELAQVKGHITAIARSWTELGKSKSVRGARRSIQNVVFRRLWAERGHRLDLLPRALVPQIIASLQTLRDDAERDLRRARPTLFDGARS